MDFLTLELTELTVSQAVLELGRVLEAHPEARLRVILGAEDTIRVNVLKLLEKRGRVFQAKASGSGWWVEVQEGTGVRAIPQPAAPLPAPVLPMPEVAKHRSGVLCRSSLVGDERALGRQMLLGVLSQLPDGTPWVALVLDALRLLEDPAAVAVLQQLQARGIGVRVSRESVLFPDETSLFEVMEDLAWQRALALGEARLLC